MTEAQLTTSITVFIRLIKALRNAIAFHGDRNAATVMTLELAVSITRQASQIAFATNFINFSNMNQRPSALYVIKWGKQSLQFKKKKSIM